MIISYKDHLTRDCCYSLSLDIGNSPFASDEIITIRSIIADLRSAPKLKDAPLSIIDTKLEDGKRFFSIIFEQIKITFVPVSKDSNPMPKQIDRIKIIEIVRMDLQLED